MRRVARHARRTATDLLAYGHRSGRWWVPATVVAIVAVSLLAKAAADVAVPIAIYTLL